MSGTDPGEVKRVNFHLPFSEPPSFFLFLIPQIFNKNCQVLAKNFNFEAGMTWCFVLAKRLIRYFSNSSKLVEHRTQSPVREVKLLAVWPSIAEGFPTLSSRIYMYGLLTKCEVKMAGYWPSSFFTCLWTWSINDDNKLDQ